MGEDRLVTIEALVALTDFLALARCRHARGPGSGPASVCIRLHRDQWPSGCWPPAKGDVLRIREAPTVTLEARPR